MTGESRGKDADFGGEVHQMHLAKALFLSFCLFSFGLVVDQTIRWTSRFHGFLNGIFQTIYFGIGWCIYLLPWSVAIYALYRWRKWRRFRTFLIFAPSVFMLVVIFAGLVFEPPTPQNRFRSFTKVELPEMVSEIRYSFSGGGLADYGDQYYFKCSPEEVKRLVHEMHLELDQSYTSPESYTIIRGFSDRSDPKTWVGGTQYRGGSGSWSYYLLTNKDQTEVYIYVFCI
jgi:hypothetical protein